MQGGIEVRTMSLPLRVLRRSPKVGIAYTLMLLGGYLWWILQPAAQRAAILAASSTNLAHLERVPWLVLPASSIWSGDNIGWWIGATLLCLCALEMAHGSIAAFVTGWGAEVLCPLVFKGMLDARLSAGEVSSSSRHVLDVGPSYIVASCAAAVIASSRTPRP